MYTSMLKEGKKLILKGDSLNHVQSCYKDKDLKMSHTLSSRPKHVQFIKGRESTLIDYIVSSGYERVMILCDENAPHFDSFIRAVKSEGCFVYPLQICGGEECKTLDFLKYILDNCNLNRMDRRKSLLIGYGGGAVCDLTGLAASLWLRGIDYALVPTTIIGMMDASFGGKVGINFNEIKNGIGSFYAPAAIYWNYEYLRSLPREEYINGLGEILKIALIANDDGTFIRELEEFITDTNKLPLSEIINNQLLHKTFQSILHKAVGVKMDLVCVDWEECDLDRVLNLGHSIGNPFTLGGIPHGCAVIIGILASMSIGVSKKLCEEAYFRRMLDIVKQMNMGSIITDFSWKQSESEQRVCQVLEVRGNKLREVVPISAGRVAIRNDITIAELVAAAFKIMDELKNE